MNTTVSYETALALKAAGFSQPPFSDRSHWFDTNGDLFTAIKISQRFRLVGGAMGTQFWWGNKSGIGIDGVDIIFAPTLEDIVPHLPNGFALEMWGGKHSCRGEEHINPSRTFGGNFAEAAAAAMFLAKKM